MKTIQVNASRSYSVLVGSGILNELHSHLCPAKTAERAVIISDTNVWPLYGAVVQTELETSGYRVDHFVFEAGEHSKNAENYLQILNHLSKIQFTRSDLLVALGGGVVGDITGFVAATYLRGVSYIQIPTSLLAMVDSSVGGKTAIDLPAGKNLVGAFYQPLLVLCDLSVLETLPFEDFRDGCAEVIKYGILYDPELFHHLYEQTFSFDREYVIAKCITHKRDVVAQDEFDNGGRQKLNLGHTIGHGIEVASNYSLSHGKSVALGMAIIAKAARQSGFCSAETSDQILEILERFQFQCQTSFSLQTIYDSTLSDKKRRGNTVNLIIPQQIGLCTITPVTVDTLYSMIKAGF